MIERARKTTDLTSKDVRLSGHFIAAKKIRRRTIVKNLESRVNQQKTLIVKVKGKELRYLAIIKKKLMLSRNVNKRITNNKNSTKGRNENKPYVQSRTQVKQNSESCILLVSGRVGQRWPCVLRRAALDSVSRVKEVLGSIPPATATEIKCCLLYTSPSPRD